MGDGGPDWSASALRRLIEDSPARVAVVRLEGDDVVFELVGRSAADGLGAAVEDLVGGTFRDIYPPEAAADVLSHVLAARSSGHDTYETVRDLPGGRQTVHVDVLALGDDRFVLSSLDVSAQREAERRLADVSRTAGIGLYHWNLVEGEVWWSDELHRILGHEPGEVEPTIERFLGHVHPDDRDRAVARTELVRREGSLGTTQYRVVTPDGTVKDVEGHSRSTTSADGELLYVVGTVQDITERVALQRDAELLRRVTARQSTALEVHDRIVQELSAVWLALELGDLDRARAATERATTNARAVVAELLEEVGRARGGVRPGDLVRGADPADESPITP